MYVFMIAITKIMRVDRMRWVLVHPQLSELCGFGGMMWSVVEM